MTELAPRSYQQTGIQFATTLRVKQQVTDLFPTCARCMIMDAPGAGKTLQSQLAASLLTPTNNSIMIVCPAHLVDQWFNSVAEQFPSDSVVSLEGPKKNKYLLHHARWYITSVQSLRKQQWFEALSALYVREHIDCTIIDESHYVKNPNAKQSVNLRKLTAPMDCKHVILLSATPIMKEADDLYHQLRIIDPIAFHSHELFLNTYCWFTWTSWGAMNVTLRKGAIEKLEPTFQCNTTHAKRRKCCTIQLDSGYLLGRSYAEIGLELPPIIPPEDKAVVYPTLEQSRRKVYDDLKYYWYSKLSEGDTLDANSAMELMHLLRRITNSPEKSLSLAQFMQDDPGPYVIACFYRQSAKELAEFINKIHPDKRTLVITGEIDADERVRLAKSSTDPNDVVIATIPSISEGCDLSHANTVYFYEEDWTPGKMYQFLSRVQRHRNNDGAVTITEDNRLVVDENPNDRPVICRYFNIDNSIDQRIHAVQHQRSVNVKDLIKAELVL